MAARFGLRMSMVAGLGMAVAATVIPRRPVTAAPNDGSTGGRTSADRAATAPVTEAASFPGL